MNNIACTEVFELFQILGKEYKNRIPEKIWNFIKNNKLINYDIIEVRQNLWNGKISKEALNIYSALNFQYIIEDEFEKKILSEIYQYNNKTKTIEQTFFDVNYLNDIFESKNNNPSKGNLELSIIKKETFFDKILNKIKNFFRKR